MAIPIAAVCVVISAFCSGTEVALFSLRRVDREQLARSERSSDQRILRMLERPRRLIATVLIGNQAFNSLLAVITLATVLRLRPVESPWLLGAIALGVALPLIVLIAEVTSKTLAAKAPLAWSRVCAAPLALFAFLVTPVRMIVQFTAELLLRPLGDKVRTRPARDLSEEEFRNLLDAGSAQGQIDARERRLIHRVFEFNDKNVGQVMTPRERIFALSYDLPMQRLVKGVAARGFSRVPIYQKSLDNVRGILNAKDLVRNTAGQPLAKPLAELLHEPLFVPRTTPVKRLFLTFKQKKVHMAVVVSEYGKVLGLVTMDDLLAQIFGVLRDERAELQSSIPGRTRLRTPVAGARTEGEITGQVGKVDAVDTGPVPRVDSDISGRVGRDSEPAMADVLDPPPPPPPPGIRPIHPRDEVTPPAIDVGELLERGRDHKRS
ncbi:MAG: HlyC/CorC family transporter [Deltaproteobacteria bacterium]|nr:HlyC/CorC family transporter [Deltaproteobacteria bacterium]